VAGDTVHPRASTNDDDNDNNNGDVAVCEWLVIQYIHRPAPTTMTTTTTMRVVAVCKQLARRVEWYPSRRV
jgi:hypothetical protein